MSSRLKWLLCALACVAATRAGAIPIQLFPSDTPEPAKPSAKETPYQAKLREGMTALAGGNLETAEAAFNAAVKLDAKAHAPVLGLAEIAARRNRLPEAERLTTQALALSPKSAEVATAAGRVAAATGKREAAEKHFQSATALDPKFMTARLDLAELFLNTNRARESAQAYRAAIGVDAKHAGAHFGLGRAQVALGERGEALKSFEKSAELSPSNPLPWMAASEMHMAAKDYDKALAALDAASKANTDYLPARLAKGNVWALRGDAKRALAEYQDALKYAQGPAAGAVHVKIGILHQGGKRIDEADRAYQAAMTADPNAAIAYNNRAWLASERKTNLNDALTWAKKATELGPKVATFHDTLGTVYLARKEVDPAIAAFRTATDLAPKTADYHYRLGIALEQKKQNADAVKAFQQALELKKDFADAADARRRLDALKGR